MMQNGFDCDLIGGKLCASDGDLMFDNDHHHHNHHRLSSSLSDSNDSISEHSSGGDKYHTLDNLTDTYDTIDMDTTHLLSGVGNGEKRKCPSSGDAITNVTNGGNGKRMPPANGKKTKGRVKIKMEFIDNKLRRYTTFSKRKTGIMKKAYELSTLTGTQVMLLVASETGHVYTFATRKLQPMITSDAGKALIQTCLNSPDLGFGNDERMSARRDGPSGFEETELTYTVNDDSPEKSDESVDGITCGGTNDDSALRAEALTNGSVSTYNQMESSLPLNYLSSEHAINSNKRQIALLQSSLPSSVNSSLSSTSVNSSFTQSSSSTCTTSALSSSVSHPTLANSTVNNHMLKTGTTIGSKANGSMPNATMSTHSSAHQLINAANVLLCTNGSQITLQNSTSPSVASSNGQTLMYNPAQGLVYATANGTATSGTTNGVFPEFQILNLGQNNTNEYLISSQIMRNDIPNQMQLQQRNITPKRESKKLRTK